MHRRPRWCRRRRRRAPAAVISVPSTAPATPRRPSVTTTAQPWRRMHRGREGFRRAGQVERRRDRRGLDRVDDQHVDRREQRRRQRLRGCGVEDHARAASPRPDREIAHGLDGDFELQGHRGPRAERRIGNVHRECLGVRARNHRDRVLPARFHVDQRDSGRPRVPLHPRDVDARRDQPRQGRGGERVGAHGAGHGDVGTGTARRERLIGPLAAGEHGEGKAGDRLAGMRQALGARDEVEIDRAEDDDHGCRLPWTTVPIRHS